MNTYASAISILCSILTDKANWSTEAHQEPTIWDNRESIPYAFLFALSAIQHEPNVLRLTYKLRNKRASTC